ncbi:keratin, type II cytoskeletal 2 epidermal-like [Penaeus monodon]|uniref:keratin, type II cytoskeletal 2 epidermal-like n=1 Tax=Penaeus monodon TaxID=6687 RepID=UPI0018A70947|nr:keratin, type II cytoskeletal 2 epidermal-like [Penaeus monodon]
MCTTPMCLALLLLVGVNGAAVVGEDEGPGGSWAACEGAVCYEVLRQTEGLHRLKLLRGYIIQTMRLMDKLATTMDEELIQAGREMADFIGPKCEASHAFLRDIIATSAAADRSDVNENFSSTSQRENLIEEDGDDDRWTAQTSSTATFRDENDYDSQEDDLEQSSSFISSTSTSSSTSRGRGFSTQSTTNKVKAHGNGGKDLGGGPPQGSPRPPYVPPETPGTTDWRGRGSTERGRHTWSEGNRGHHGGSGWRGSHHRAESTTSRKYYTDASGSTGSGWGGASGGRGGTGSGWGGASDGNGGTGSGWGGASSGSTGSGWGGANGGSTGSGWGGANGGSGCKGVPPGSPNWVPGLDQWCAQNCPTGYCPEAQCVC